MEVQLEFSSLNVLFLNQLIRIKFILSTPLLNFLKVVLNFLNPSVVFKNIQNALRSRQSTHLTLLNRLDIEGVETHTLEH